MSKHVAPKGNKYAVGNKGGRRPTAVQERKQAELLEDIWSVGLRVQELKDRLAKTDVPIPLKDRFFLMALEGNERFLIEIFKRLYPEQINLGGNIGHYVITRSRGEVGAPTSVIEIEVDDNKSLEPAREPGEDRQLAGPV